MWNWLRGLYNDAKGGLSTIEKWIVAGLTAVYSYIDDYVHQLEAQLGYLYDESKQLYEQFYQYLISLYNLAQWIINTGIPNVENWAWGEIQKIYGYINSVEAWIGSFVQKVVSWALSALDGLAQWVISNIWNPLWNYIQGILHWIENEGALAYYLLTHPDKLAAIIGKYLLSAWMSLGRTYAKPFVRWLIHNMLSEASFVGSILEDIIASLF